MVTSNLVSAAGQATAASLLLSGHATLWELAVLAAANGTASAFFFPASTGIVPQTVPADLLQRANATLRLALNATNITGAALGGVIVGAAGPGTAIAVDAASYGLAAACIAAMNLPPGLRSEGSVFGVLWDTAMQQEIPGERLSRLSAYDALGSFILMPIGLAAIGPVASAIGNRVAFLGSGAVIAIATALVLASRDVRTLERRG
jgi:Transmembrane secretion effector